MSYPTITVPFTSGQQLPFVVRKGQVLTFEMNEDRCVVTAYRDRTFHKHTDFLDEWGALRLFVIEQCKLIKFADYQ